MLNIVYTRQQSVLVLRALNDCIINLISYVFVRALLESCEKNLFLQNGQNYLPKRFVRYSKVVFSDTFRNFLLLCQEKGDSKRKFPVPAKRIESMFSSVKLQNKISKVCFYIFVQRNGILSISSSAEWNCESLLLFLWQFKGSG